MVGIPGKSKGCHTCRKRKIKCDLQQPDCQRCIRSGRVCEGYNRGAVFLNRTTEGWTKRQRLEEAQPRNYPEGRQDISRTSQRGSHSSGTQTTHTTPSLETGGIWPIAQVSDTNVKKQLFQGLFLESYLPADVTSIRGMQGAWISEALRINMPETALDYAFQAISITRVGRFTGHQDLIARGKATYGQALRALFLALGSPKLAGKDETLAACSILAVYEMFESTSNSTSAHEGHMAGVERLVLYRGARQIETPLGRALMKNICYGTMIMSLQYRKTSQLKGLIDSIEWWDMQGKLYAKGHDIGALLDELDRYKNSGNYSLPASAQYLKQCVHVNAELEHWYEDLKKESPSPIFWAEDNKALPGFRLSFANLTLAQLMQDYWALRLVISTTISVIVSQAPKEVPVTFQNMLKQLDLQHGTAGQLKLSTSIMESMGYCMRDEHGAGASQKCIFSGRVALYSLRHSPPEQLRIYEKLFRDLSEKKGLRFAEDIDKMEMSKWTPVLTERVKAG